MDDFSRVRLYICEMKLLCQTTICVYDMKLQFQTTKSVIYLKFNIMRGWKIMDQKVKLL